MESDPSVKTARVIAIVFYALGVLTCIAGLSRFDSNMEDVFQWLPDDTPDRQVYDDFVQLYGVDDFLVVTWPNCTVADSRCDAFADACETSDPDNLIGEVLTGRELVRQLVSREHRSPSEIIKRFEGIYFGPDGQTTCATIGLTVKGMSERTTSVDLVKQIAEDSTGVPKDELILAGYPQVGAYGDAVVRESILLGVGPSCIISTVVAWLCLRRISLTLVLLAISGLATGLSISIVTLSGAKWGGLSSAIPTLTHVLTVSGAMHFINYSRTPGNDRLLMRVLRIGWKPCVLSALTTSAGMISLCRSDFPAVRDFGVYCACGVLASLVCQLLLVPCAIDWIKPTHLPPIDANARSPWLDNQLLHSRQVLFGFIGVTLVAGWGLHYLRSDLEVERNFSKRSTVMQDIAWLEKNIGPVEQTELLISFPDTQAAPFESRVKAIEQVSQTLKSMPEISNVISLTAWLPEEPSGRGLGATAERSAYRKVLQSERPMLATTPYLRFDDTGEQWRISLRFPFLGSTDFKYIKTAIPEAAERSLKQALPQAEVKVQHTGASLLYHVAQNDLVNDLYKNFAFAFLLICPLMILVLRSFKQGLLSMIPNVCPAVVAFGTLGWLDFPIDIGMAMTSCVALGIAVDDTTHFMIRFQDIAREKGNNLIGALKMAFQQCSRAMFYTSLTAGLGLTAFLFTPLAAMVRFSALLITLIGIALACDLLLLPSLLKTFCIGKDPTEPPADSGHDDQSSG